jgi:nitrogen fixation/metabolism regulation signal transduction histidine kinase
MSAPFATRTIYSLRLKLTVPLILLVLTPLAAALWLTGQITETAANFHAAEASASLDALDKAGGAYRELFETTKRLEAEIADRVAKKRELQTVAPAMDVARVLAEESALEPSLRAVAVVRPDTTIVAQASRPRRGDAFRDKVVEQPLATGDATLQLTFEVSATLQSELQDLKKAHDTAQDIAQLRAVELPSGIRYTFLAFMAAFVAVAGVVGWVMSTQVTRHIERLVTTARQVSDGKLDARVELHGRDEIAELGRAFNTMLDDLDHARNQLQYAQRMGVWQDVARRLAHEIKNPLTPIQLAVQQCVSSYKGDDPRFKKLLGDAGEIVEEEIAGLRRLVDTFRTLGALPKVEKAPLALADVVEELRLDPEVASRLELAPPEAPVTVRADKLLLKRVLANLVENGIHAGQEAGTAGKVVIGWRADRAVDSAVITVDDSGRGVADADRERIFEPYVTTKSTGTGLGLAIAKKICIEHGGELTVAPERAPTGGARFIVSLPMRGPEMSLG